MVIKIELAATPDLSFLLAGDADFTAEKAQRKIDLEEIIVAREGDEPVGYLRWSYFWDDIPFINWVNVIETYRDKGIGSQLVKVWETSMRTLEHRRVMTSSQASEESQFFFRKLGYHDRGALTLPSEPLEILFLKEFY